MKKAQIKAIEQWLDSRYQMAVHMDLEMGNADGHEFLQNNPNFIYYKGAINLLETAGFNWIRNGEGHHLVFNP